MKTRNILLFFSFLIIFPFVLKAQPKYEREYRIESEIVPLPAKEFIDSIGAGSKIRWYKEIGFNSVSLEAKFKYKNKMFSAEFDTLGNLQDVEYIIKKREISSIVYTKIEHKLDSLYQKWKFQKIQIHYNGKPSDILTAINKKEQNENVTLFYEIILKGKTEEGTELYELTFNHQGTLQKIQQIVQDKADHLEY